jgi:2-methylcitrate dehydratase PrpD
MSSTTKPTAALCHWVCSTPYGDLPPEVRKETATLLYDQVGCMIASATLPACQPVVNLVRRLSPSGACSVVGHPARTSVTHAALANGIIGHGDEVDSTGQHGTGHYAATTVPTALSAGQYVGASGQELILALALGSEVAARLQSILGHYGTMSQSPPASVAPWEQRSAPACCLAWTLGRWRMPWVWPPRGRVACPATTSSRCTRSSR